MSPAENYSFDALMSKITNRSRSKGEKKLANFRYDGARGASFKPMFYLHLISTLYFFFCYQLKNSSNRNSQHLL